MTELLIFVLLCLSIVFGFCILILNAILKAKNYMDNSFRWGGDDDETNRRSNAKDT